MSTKRLSKDLETLELQLLNPVPKTKFQKLKEFFVDIWEDYFFDKLETFYYNQKYKRINKKKFKNLINNHRDWDYDGFFEFMDVFLEGQINLSNSYSLNREKLVKRLKVMKTLLKRIRDDDYIHQEYDYFYEAKKFNDIFKRKENLPFNKNKCFNQRKKDLEYFCYLLNKTILHCWD